MQDIDLYHLLKFYAKKWLWIIISTAIGSLAGFIYSTYVQTPLYKSDATLLLVSTDDRKIGQDSTLINNYIELIKSRRVLEPVIDKQSFKISYDELVSSITAINEKNTEVIKVTIASADPQSSKQLVSGVVASFKDEVKELYNLDNINIVDNASKATRPYNVNTTTHTMLTATAGFVTSIILLFFAYDISSNRKAIKEAPADKNQRNNKTTRQGGLLGKIADLLIGKEVQPEQLELEIKTTNKKR